MLPPHQLSDCASPRHLLHYHHPLSPLSSFSPFFFQNSTLPLSPGFCLTPSPLSLVHPPLLDFIPLLHTDLLFLLSHPLNIYPSFFPFLPPCHQHLDSLSSTLCHPDTHTHAHMHTHTCIHTCTHTHTTKQTLQCHFEHGIVPVIIIILIKVKLEVQCGTHSHSSLHSDWTPGSPMIPCSFDL